MSFLKMTPEMVWCGRGGKDGVVKNSEEQELDSRKICQKFLAERDWKGVGEQQLQMSG